MVSFRINKAFFAADSDADASTAGEEAHTERAPLDEPAARRLRLQRPGRAPLAFFGRQILSVTRPASQTGLPRHQLEIYERADGGFVGRLAHIEPEAEPRVVTVVEADDLIALSTAMREADPVSFCSLPRLERLIAPAEGAATETGLEAAFDAIRRDFDRVISMAVKPAEQTAALGC